MKKVLAIPGGRLRFLLGLALVASALAHGIVLGVPLLISLGNGRNLTPFDVQFSVIKEVVETQRERYEEISSQAVSVMKTREKEKGTFTWTRDTFPDNLRLLGQSMGLAIRDVRLSPSRRGPRLAVEVGLFSPADKAVSDLLMTVLLIGQGTLPMAATTEEAVITIMEKNGPGKHEVTVPTRFCRDYLSGRVGLLDLITQMQIS